MLTTTGANAVPAPGAAALTKMPLQLGCCTHEMQLGPAASLTFHRQQIEKDPGKDRCFELKACLNKRGDPYIF